MIGERPTGPELVAALRAAAAKAGLPLHRFVEPICTSTADNLLAQLRRATKPVQATVDRVTALIAGEPIPPPRESPFRGHYGKRERPQAQSGEMHISGDIIAARRAETERAHAERLPGESIADALRRIAKQQKTITNLEGSQ